MARPLLFLDVDGVLHLWGTPAEAMTHVPLGGHTFRHAAALPERLARLDAAFTLVWATTWGDDANDVLCPLFGLQPLPVLCFDVDDVGPGEMLKMPAIRRFAGESPCAWIDDEPFGEDALHWERTRREPTLLVQTQPATGLGDGELDRLLAFARSCERG